LNQPQFNDQKCPSEHSSNKDQQEIFNADLYNPFAMNLGLGGGSNLLYN
jgi:hypothetical protein